MDLNNCNDLINTSKLLLSTITTEGKLSNIEFNIQDIIKKININLNNNIIKIGCNYGEYIDDLYLELIKKEKKKSNRGRKPKPDIKKNKAQGNGKYFNSQITFTILHNKETKKMYHIKLFVNGVIQIPAVINEDILIVKPEIDQLINFINNYDDFKSNIDKKVNLIYFKSIMNNYKFSIQYFNDNIQYKLDLTLFEQILIKYKHNHQFYNLNIIEDDNIIKFIADNDIINPTDDIYNNFDDIKNNTNTIKSIDDYSIDDISEKIKKIKEKIKYTFKHQISIYIIRYNKEIYPALVATFNTPTLLKPKKVTTVKIFGSGKFNIDGANNKLQSIIIKNILMNIIIENKNILLY